jgi:hypothetical protein
MPRRIRKRSSCDSGSGWVPWCSRGFWVAITKKGRGSTWVTPSTVAAPSLMASSSADCTFGLARLISSASTMLAKIGPGWNTKALGVPPPRPSGSDAPSRSLGSRSLVNWMRRKLASRERARAWARVVLPTPGTSSSSRWPPATSVSTARRTTSGLPRSARSTLERRRPAHAAASTVESLGIRAASTPAFFGPKASRPEPPPPTRRRPAAHPQPAGSARLSGRGSSAGAGLSGRPAGRRGGRRCRRPRAGGRRRRPARRAARRGGARSRAGRRCRWRPGPGRHR